MNSITPTLHNSTDLATCYPKHPATNYPKHPAALYSRHTAKSQNGFTLIEVMVALAIFAAAAAGLIGSITNATFAEDQLRVRTVAFWVAQNRMTEVYLQSHWPSVGDTSGEAENMMAFEWHWKMKVVATSAKNLRRVEIEIRRDPEQENSDAFLVGFVGKF